MILDTNMDDADYLCQTFSESLEDGTEVDLIPNGHDIPVTEANKQEFIRLLIEYKYKVSIAPFVDAMSNGMKEVLSSSIVSQIGHLFTPDSFRIILCGQPVIDVEEMINGTTRIGQVIAPVSEEKELDSIMDSVYENIIVNGSSLRELWENH